MVECPECGSDFPENLRECPWCWFEEEPRKIHHMRDFD